MTYEFKTKPFKHQLEFFERTKDLVAHAVYWEQGTGKTKVTIDTAAQLYEKGEIDTVIIVAPNGVHSNWINDEIPNHLPDKIANQSLTYIYYTGKAKSKDHAIAAKTLLEYKGMSWLAISYDSLLTKSGKDLVGKMLVKRKCLYILDEATRIKTPTAARTKACIKSGKFAKYRRILTGTPLANGPFDVFAPIQFLDPTFWKRVQLDNFWMFKRYFGIFKIGKNADREFNMLVGYQRLDELNKILQGISSRVMKSEVLDLPPKLYQTRYFQMTEEQSRVYHTLREEFVVWLNSEEVVTANLAITRLMRLQQILSGFVPVESENPLREIEGGNPRLALLKEILEDIEGKAIIWARFQRDVDNIMELCREMKISAVRYDGKTPDADRTRAKESFQNGDTRLFVGNPAVGGEGLTLHAANKMIYYNNSFKLTERLQSEDRAHRIGQNNPVTYIDLVGESTIDQHILRSLKKKLDISNEVLGDNLRGELKKWFSV